MHQPVLRTVAAAGEHPLIDIDLTVLIQFGLFMLMAMVATRLLFRPYLKMREERTAGIEGARREAQELSSEADARLSDYEAKLASARDRALEEQRKIRAEAAAHQREVTEKARIQANASLEEARAKVQAQTESARAELMPRADGLAQEMVSRLLGRQVA
jgi:F-type H+-transporting ATPase subunit b